MKKRFLLALIAASMSLAGCGNKNKPEQPADNTPSGGGEVDPDALTPEQQEEADGIKVTIDTYLGYAFDRSVVSQCDEYTVAYSEEIAREGIDSVAVGAGIAQIAVLAMSEDVDAAAVVGFLIEQYEDETLKDTVYGGVALAKSLLRVGALVSEEEEKAQIEFIADYLDKEGTKLHENLYDVVGIVARSASLIASDDFIRAASTIYDEETNQISFASLAASMRYVGTIIYGVTLSADNVQYLVDLAVNGVVGYVTEFVEDSEDIVAIIESIDFDTIIQKVFSYVGLGGLGIVYLAGEDSPVAYIVELVNLALKEEYEELAIKLISDYFSFIETEVTLDDLGEEFYGIVGAVSGVVEALSSEEFSAKLDAVMAAEDEEAAVPAMKEVVLAVGEALEGVLVAEENVVKLVEYVVDIVGHSLVAVAGFTADEVAEMFEGFEASESVGSVFGALKSAVEFIKAVGNPESEGYEVEFHAVYEVIEAIKGGETAQIVTAVLGAFVDILYEEFAIESVVKAEFGMSIMLSLGVVYVVSQYLTEGEEFRQLVEGLIVIDSKTGAMTVSEEGVIAFCAGIADDVVNPIGALPGYFETILTVIEEVVEKLSDESEAEAIQAYFAPIIAALGEASDALGKAVEFLKDKDALAEYMPMINEYGNLILEGVSIIVQYEQTGYLDLYKVIEYICEVAAKIIEQEPAPLAINDYADIEGKVGEVIGLDYVEQLIEQGATIVHEARGVAFEVLEEEGVYTLQVTIVASCQISIEAGEVTTVNIQGLVYSFSIPAEFGEALMYIQAATQPAEPVAALA